MTKWIFMALWSILSLKVSEEKVERSFCCISPFLFLKEQVPSPTYGLYWTFTFELKIVKHEAFSCITSSDLWRWGLVWKMQLESKKRSNHKVALAMYAFVLCNFLHLLVLLLVGKICRTVTIYLFSCLRTSGDC